MNLKSIALTGFRSHIKTKIVGLGKVNIFVGPNGAGKSTILDAISYALTGVTRGVDDGGKGADALACQLAGAPETSTTVILSTDKGEILRGLGQGPKSQAHVKIVSKLGMDDKVLRVLAAPMNLLRLPNKKQEEVFFSLTGSSITAETIGEALTAAGINLEATPVDLDELLTPNGRDAKLAYWKQRRVEMKRQIQGLVFTPSDQELPPADEVKRRGLEAEFTKLNDAVTRGKGAGEQAQQSVQHFDELITGAEAKLKQIKDAVPAKAITPAEAKKLRAMVDDVSKWREEKGKKAAEFTAATQAKSKLEQEAQKIKDLGRECVSCGQEITKAATDKKLAAMRKAFTEAATETSKLSGELAALEKKIDAVDVNDALTKINLSERAGDEAARRTKAIKEATADLDALRERREGIAIPEGQDWTPQEAKLADLRNRIDALKAAEIEAGRQMSVNSQRSEIEENLEIMEKMLKAVGPGGTVQQAMASGGTENMVAAVREIGAKLGVGDIGIKFGPWQITLNGRDIELASASEEFRVAAAFGIAFAKAAGASMVCLDGAEILRGDNRELFQDLLFSCELEQIFVAFASDAIPECFEPQAGLTMFSVTKDERGASSVKAIKQTVAA